MPPSLAVMFFLFSVTFWAQELLEPIMSDVYVSWLIEQESFLVYLGGFCPSCETYMNNYSAIGMREGLLLKPGSSTHFPMLLGRRQSEVYLSLIQWCLLWAGDFGKTQTRGMRGTKVRGGRRRLILSRFASLGIRRKLRFWCLSRRRRARNPYHSHRSFPTVGRPRLHKISR